MAKPTPADQTHEIHTDATGRWAWTEEHGLYRLNQPLAEEHRFGALHTMDGAPAPMQSPVGVVVLRCRCDDGLAHATNGQHCPQAEIDMVESIGASMGES